MPTKSHGTDLARLVGRCRAGDPRAWDVLVDRFSNLVFSICRRVGLSHADAEDATQTVFLRLFQNLDRIDEPEALAGWLSVTTSREALRVKRIAGRTVNLDAEDRGLEETLVAEEEAADEVASVAESVFTVTNALETLRKKCQDLLRALYLEDEPSYTEISTRLGIPIGSIGPTRARCIETLRSNLAKAGFFEEDVSKGAGSGSEAKSDETQA
ncbi:MAG TPA: sigma-70 family RNA polymerase sigma factor [Fimbriimonadaceae bacterium]|nr:sigma-70 family RNA polymerase sigma factor [Fimbriimonadaceae bacterium]